MMRSSIYGTFREQAQFDAKLYAFAAVLGAGIAMGSALLGHPIFSEKKDSGPSLHPVINTDAPRHTGTPTRAYEPGDWMPFNVQPQPHETTPIVSRQVQPEVTGGIRAELNQDNLQASAELRQLRRELGRLADQVRASGLAKNPDVGEKVPETVRAKEIPAVTQSKIRSLGLSSELATAVFEHDDKLFLLSRRRTVVSIISN